MKIVVVEDNLTLLRSIEKVLHDEGHLVHTLTDGAQALTFVRIEKNAIDVMIVDYMLPGLDGVSLIGTLRAEGITVPVLMLTARDSLYDKVKGLKVGADYYLTKPFAFEELLACLQALYRRPAAYQNEIIELWPGFMCDIDKRQVFKDDQSLLLTPTEFSIFEYLLRNKGRTVTASELYEHVFDFAKEHWSNSLEVHIKNLRKKLQHKNHENLIHTIRGVGYTLKA